MGIRPVVGQIGHWTHRRMNQWEIQEMREVDEVLKTEKVIAV